MSFLDDGLYAANDMGYLMKWDLDTRRVSWSIQVSRKNKRRGQIQTLLQQQDPPRELPLPFARANAAILSSKDGKHVLTMGEDACVRIWKTDLSERRRAITEIKSKTGPSPVIAFDPQHPHILWTVDKSGTLSAVDTLADRVLDQKRNAHQGGKVGICVLKKTGDVLTVGSDRFIHCWQLKNGVITQAKSKTIKHQRALISVGASPDGRLIAAVDQTGFLTVWSRESGEIVFKTLLTGGKPLTGKIAFNLAGDRLAAFGGGQSCHVFECDLRKLSFTRINEQPEIAGLGGTALRWSPSPKRHHLLFTADSHPGYALTSFGDDPQPEGKIDFRDPTPTHCVEIIATPDGRRVVVLNESGEIRFFDPVYGLQMLELYSTLDETSGLAINATGSRLAVAGTDGRIEIWETEPPQKAFIPPSVSDKTGAWELQVLLNSPLRFNPPARRHTRIDGQGRVYTLFVEHDPQKQDDGREGALYFLRYDGTQVLRERIRVDDSLFDRRMDYLAMTLDIRPSGEPTIFFRRRDAKQSPYDGTNYLAQRDAAGKWHFDIVFKEANLGFWPAIFLNEDGDVAEIFHYCYSRWSLLRSLREPGNSEWKTMIVGRQGDGSKSEAWRDTDNRIHCTYEAIRFSGDVGQAVHAVWEGQPPLRRYPDVTPQPLPDGTPVLVEDGLLKRWRDGSWEADPTIPKIPLSNYQMSPDGTSYALHMDQETNDFFVATLEGDKWSIGKVSLRGFDCPSQPTSYLPLFDPEGRPLILVGVYHQPKSWMGVLRMKSE